jgi:hypothetical protein
MQLLSKFVESENSMNIRTIDIKGKPYTPVAERVRLVHETRESFEIIESAPIQAGDRWLWRAIIRVDERQYIGTAEVKLNARPGSADATDPWACAETSAIGRALGFANLGVVESIASADEVIQAVEQEQPQDETINAVSKPLYNAASQAKQRALKLNVITDDQGWIDLLGTLGITEIGTGKDIATLNNKITELSKRVQKAS